MYTFCCPNSMQNEHKISVNLACKKKSARGTHSIKSQYIICKKYAGTLNKMWVKCSQINHSKGHRSSNKVCKFIDFIASNKYTVFDYRVRTLFSTKHWRIFQGLSRKHVSLFQGLQEVQNQANIMPHQMLKVESAPIFVSDLRSFFG